MDQIRQNMMKAAQELRALAKTTDDPVLRKRLLDQADQLELTSQEDSQDETDFERGRPSLAVPPTAPS